MKSHIFADLVERIIKFRELRDWKQFHQPKDMALSLVLESAELLELFQWKNGKELDAYLNEQRTAVGEELADILYWVLLLSHDLGIDLSSAFEAKMKRNEEKYPVAASYGKSDKYDKL